MFVAKNKKKPFHFLILPLLFMLPNFASCQKIDRNTLDSAIEEKFLDAAKGKKNIQSANLLIHSDKLKLHITKSYGTFVRDGKSILTTTDQPFHVASVGKMFTSALVFLAIEKNKITLETPIITILNREYLKGLYEMNGMDYSEKVTIRQLLNHTSGVADYFESTDSKKEPTKTVLEEISKDPSRFWTPDDLIEFTRTNQKAVGKPGEKFLYSDTGYVLLGKILEKIYQKNFETILAEQILIPLHMDSTYMHLRSLPKNPKQLELSPMFLENEDVTGYKSISADWAGGGIVSTTEDLLLFQKALVTGKLVSLSNYQKMVGTYRFMDGIEYGLGLMTVRYGDMLFLMAGTPELYGHSGLLSTLCFYTPEYDAYIIANFGSTKAVDSAFEMMFHLMRILKDIQDAL